MYKALDHNNLPTNHRKELMKITSVSFGLCGYQGAMFGMDLNFESKGTGCGVTIDGGWDYVSIPCSQHAKWKEADRTKNLADMCRTISKILSAAKVTSVDKLKNIPVEVVIESGSIKSFRILEEVL